VAQSRHMSVETVDAVGQGRVWTGQQAKQRGLVDELGGLDKAVAIAKQRANIPANEDVEIAVYPSRPSFYEIISQFGASRASLEWLNLAGGLIDREALAASVPVRLFRRGEPLALMPFTFLR